MWQGTTHHTWSRIECPDSGNDSPFRRSWIPIVRANRARLIPSLCLVTGIKDSAWYPDVDECRLQCRSLFQQDHGPRTFLHVHNKQCHSTSSSPDSTHIVVPNSLIVACTATESNSCRYKLNLRSSTSTGVQGLFQGRAINSPIWCSSTRI
jgi:hypothetical protein